MISSFRLPAPGIVFALSAAILFGASTPFSKVLLGSIEPVGLAGLLYLGSGVGLTVLWWLRLRFKRGNTRDPNIRQADIPWLAGAIVSGGIVGPVLLMIGLVITPASSASLLLNLEGVFTALIAWFVFKENVDRRIAFGMAVIAIGGLFLSWSGRPEMGEIWGTTAVAGACLAWAIDNNLTRKVSAGDPVQVAATKGLVAGLVNLTIAVATGTRLPGWPTILMVALIGLVSYGISLALFVLALRHIGTARTGAYFSTAPFVGAAISIVFFGDGFTVPFAVAAILMGVGVWLHLTERHLHEHSHYALEHEHMHIHDEHHQHAHSEAALSVEPHNHAHRHDEVLHSHSHYPDLHHRHEH